MNDLPVIEKREVKGPKKTAEVSPWYELPLPGETLLTQNTNLPEIGPEQLTNRLDKSNLQHYTLIALPAENGNKRILASYVNFMIDNPGITYDLERFYQDIATEMRRRHIKDYEILEDVVLLQEVANSLKSVDTQCEQLTRGKMTAHYIMADEDDD